LPLRPGENLAVIIPDQQGDFLCIVSQRGQVRRIAAHYLGRNLNAGAVIHDPKEGGGPVAACWSSGRDELIIATNQGRAIRFPERLVPVRGCLGLRVEPNDRVAAVAAAPADGNIFMLADDGKGALRAVESFAANKSPGSGGKTLMKTDALVAMMNVTPAHDLFLLSRLGKLIRFPADDVPPKEGPVQGVNCMALRADVCVAGTAARILTVVEPDAD
jgi:DNA gyrase subunit A